MSLESDREQQALDLLVSKFPSRYAVETTTNLLGLLKALSTGDGFISTTVEAVRANSTTVAATGKLLDRLASLYGVVRGVGSGVLDDGFRKIVPLLGYSPKQITHTLLALIDTIYGPYATHSNLTATTPEPYSIRSGFSLLLRVDGSLIEVTFTPEDAVNLLSASADEIAIAISKKTDGKVIGSVVTNESDTSFLNLRTATIGSQGFIQVVGGSAQSCFRFPDVRPLSGTVGLWNVTRHPGTSEMQYTVASGSIPNWAAAGVVKGDSCTIRSDSGFSAANTGTFEVTYVGDTFFRVSNVSGTPETSVGNFHTDDFTFFSPKLGNILLSERPASVLETSAKELTVLLPVTPPLVRKSLKGGHHFIAGLSPVTATTSSTMTLTSINGFSSSGSVRVIGSRKSSAGIISSVTINTVTLIDAQNWPSQGAFWAPTARQFYYYSGITGNTLRNVSPSPTSQIVSSSVEYSDRHRYTGLTGNTLTGVYPDPTGLYGAEVVCSELLLNSSFIGGYLFDTQASFIASKISTPLKETIKQGDVKTIVSVEDTSEFPDSGYFVIEYGTGFEEGPIKFLAKVGTSGLVVDPGYAYKISHLPGVGVRLIRQIGAYSPKLDGSDYPSYLTSTSPARDLLLEYIAMISAAGINVRKELIIPDQKWPVLPNLYGETETSTTV